MSLEILCEATFDLAQKSPLKADSSAAKIFTYLSGMWIHRIKGIKRTRVLTFDPVPGWSCFCTCTEAGLTTCSSFWRDFFAAFFDHEVLPGVTPVYPA